MILSVLILVIATIALVISIKLVFTIGRQTSIGSSSSSYNITTATTPSTSLSLTLVTSVLTEPCGCGCPSVKPEFGALRKVYAANGIWSSHCQTLTAAHCVYGRSPRFVYIFAGQHALNLDISISLGFASVAIHVHEPYDLVSGRNDIAVVILKEPVRFDAYVSPACLARPISTSSLLQPKETLIVTRQGHLSGETNSTAVPSHLLQVKSVRAMRRKTSAMVIVAAL